MLKCVQGLDIRAVASPGRSGATAAAALQHSGGGAGHRCRVRLLHQDRGGEGGQAHGNSAPLLGCPA